jgi:hypothetical protein
MYLARIEAGLGQHRYVLRESYLRDGIYCFRDLADLGRDPGRFLVYSSEISFHIDEGLLRRLRDQGVTAAYSEIEELFFPFIDPYLQSRLQPFRDRYKYHNWKPADQGLRSRALRETHAMDRRRLLFLRLGRTSVETIDKASALFIALLDKSRDEIEQMILSQEQALPPREYPQYLFAIFDLQRFFPESYALSIPQALNREQLDAFFVEAVCQLAADSSFWQGFSRGDRLPSYLVRYLLMYFDATPEEPMHWSRFSRASRSRRQYRPAAPVGGMSRQLALLAFGLSSEQLAGLRKKDLTRLYRQKAHELHPDKGGDTEEFIRLTAAYNELLPSLP